MAPNAATGKAPPTPSPLQRPSAPAGQRFSQTSFFQRTIGNQAVADLLQIKGKLSQPDGYELETDQGKDGEQVQRAGTQSKEGSPTGGSQPELEKRPLNFLSTARPELIVGDANDPLEREADRIAERVTADGDSPRVTSSVGAEIATPDVGRRLKPQICGART